MGRATLDTGGRVHRAAERPGPKTTWRHRCGRRRRHPPGLPGPLQRLMLARLLVIVFALIVVGVGAAVGYFVLGDSTPILGGRISQLADPMAPVDPQDSARIVV